MISDCGGWWSDRAVDTVSWSETGDGWYQRRPRHLSYTQSSFKYSLGWIQFFLFSISKNYLLDGLWTAQRFSVFFLLVILSQLLSHTLKYWLIGWLVDWSVPFVLSVQLIQLLLSRSTPGVSEVSSSLVWLVTFFVSLVASFSYNSRLLRSSRLERVRCTLDFW